MFAPIYLPLAPAPSPEVLAAERDILADEGYLTVAGVQYASASDATQARRWEAERRVRNYARFTRWAAQQAAALAPPSATVAAPNAGRAA